MEATKVNIHEAKTHLSRLLERVAAGEEFIICKAGRPVAVLTPVFPTPKQRLAGTWTGQIEFSEDIDEPLPEEITDEFEGCPDARPD